MPAPVVNTLCDVDNCAQCYGQNQCSICFLGYYLTDQGNCEKITCSDSNCELCDADASFCFTCVEGYMPEGLLSSTCVSIAENYECNVDGCAVCASDDPNSCIQCQELYEPNGDNSCTELQCLDNCIFCLASDTCMICDPGYYLSAPDYVCKAYNESQSEPAECTIDNCLYCYESYNYDTN